MSPTGKLSKKAKMTHTEFGERLQLLSQMITQAVAYYATWKSALLHDPSSSTLTMKHLNDALDRYRGFFTPVANALLDGALLQLANAYDEDVRTSSLTILLRAAQADSTLIPHAKSGDIANIETDLKKADAARTTLKTKRNQQIAHKDAKPAKLAPLMNADFEDLLERTKSAFNVLAKAHGVKENDWTLMNSKSHHDTQTILTIVHQDMLESKAKADAAMKASRA